MIKTDRQIHIEGAQKIVRDQITALEGAQSILHALAFDGDREFRRAANTCKRAIANRKALLDDYIALGVGKRPTAKSQ